MHGVGDFRGNDRFAVLRCLGTGGMGAVYEAFDRERSERVALKTLRRVDPGLLYRLKTEFRALQDLHHPNLVHLGELIEAAGHWFFTMELIEGVDFVTWVRSPPTERGDSYPTMADIPRARRMVEDANTVDVGGPALALALATPAGAVTPAPDPPPVLAGQFDEARLRAALRGMAEGLVSIHHAGLIHRDVKPSNVLVNREGRVVLLDFGLVHDADADASRDDHLVGTPAYMAPEQVAGGNASPASDWYAVGVTLYQSITGQLPFRGGAVEVMTAKQTGRPKPPSALLPSVPPDLDELCCALLAPAPADRPDGTAVLRALGGAVPEVRTGEQAPFVGRRHQLAQLEDALRLVREGRTVAVYVQGNSGMGKTALVDQFLAGVRAGEPRAVILQGRCYERESVPYKAVDDLVDELCQWLRRQPHTEVLALLPQHISALAGVFPVLSQIDAVATVSLGSGERPEPQDLRSQAFSALKELLARIAERRTLVLFIDDLQWGDADSAALLAEVMRSPGQPAMLLVGSFRADETAGPVIGELMRRAAGPARQRVEVREVFLDPLDTEEVRELARALAPEQSDITGRAQALARESQGSPFFVAEILRGGARGSQGAGSHGRSGEGPVSLDQAIWSRVETLPDDARALLEVIAAVGQPIQQIVALRAAGLAGAAGDPLALLRAAQFVRTRGSRPRDPVECFHDRIRETVAAHLDEQRVRDIHRQLAEVLEGSDEGDPELLALAIQLGAGADGERAFGYAVAAAERAERALAFDRAAALFAMALERAPVEGRGELHRRRADMLAFAGSGAEAAAAYRAAAAEAPGDERLELERLAADNLLRSGRIADGLVALAEVGAALGVRLPRSRGRAIAALVWQRLRLAMRGLKYQPGAGGASAGRELERLDVLFAAATTLGMVDHLRGALLQSHHLLGALRAGDETRACRALATEAVFLSVQASPAVRRRSGDLCREVRLLAEKLGDPYLIGGAHFAEGATAFFSGRYRTAQRDLREAERILSDEVVGAWWERNTARWFLYMNQISMGDFNGVASLLHRAIADAERRNDFYARSLYKGHPTVWLSLRDDRPDEAETELGSALDGWPERPWYQAHYIVQVSKLMIALYRGDAAAATALVDETRPIIRALMIHRMPFVMGEMHKLAGQAALLRGDHAEVERRAVRLDASIAVVGRALAAGLRAPLAVQQGRPDDAQRILAEAIDLFEECDGHHLIAACKYRLGQLLGGARGDTYIRDATSWMRGQGVASVDRMVQFLMPGFPLDPTR